MKILVIGAGIAGCALGLALVKAGIKCKLVDLKPAPTTTGGAFLALAANGIKAHHALGIEDILSEAGGFEQSGLEFFNAKARKISAIEGENDLSLYGARGVVMRRARLQAALVRAVLRAAIPIEYGRRVAFIRETGAGVKVEFGDGSTEQVDIVIGADGIWSQIRRTAWPQAANPNYTSILDCGGWAEVDLPDTTHQQMHFGKRAFFGYTVKDGTHTGSSTWARRCRRRSCLSCQLASCRRSKRSARPH
jgi:FAD-dependent urate hydroxylase